MRIGIDARLVGYRRGGIATYVTRLIEALGKVATDDEITVFSGRKSGLPSGGFRKRALWTPPHHPLEQWALPVELAFEALDILHCPDFIPPFRRSFPAVITVHDLAFLRFPDTKDQEGLAYYRQVGRAVAETEGIIAVTEATRGDILEMLDVEPDRVQVVHHGVSPRFHPLGHCEEIQAFRRQHRLPDRFMLWVGTIEPRKNLDALLQAVELAKETLVVAGERGWRDEATWERLRASTAIYFGPADERDLLMLYNAAWAFAYPSIYEGFGFPPLEAMACGTPVIASATAALREVLGDAALFVEHDDVEGLAEQLRRLSADIQEQRRLTEAGLARAKQFSWEECARKTLAVYRDAAGR